MYQLNPELEHLRAQQERDQKKLEQLQHRAQRLQNRINYLESAERRQRNHRLITRGAAVEHHSLRQQLRFLLSANIRQKLRLTILMIRLM